MRPLLLAALVAALGGFLFGYDTAVINGANQYLRLSFKLDAVGEGLAGASAILGCIPGAAVAGFLSDRYGRRKVLFLCAVLYAASAVFSALPRTFPQFLAARFVGGLGIGISSMVCPVYIAELAPERWRGRLGTLFQLGIVMGIFVTLFINRQIQGLGDEAWNVAAGWRWMLGAETVPAAVLLALLAAVPESPRWLLQVGREAEARRVFAAAVGPGRVEAEIAAVRAAIGQATGRFGELFGAALRRPLLVAVLLMAFSQLSGINAIMYYSTKIFTTSGVGVQDAFTASSWIGLVNVLFTFVAIALVDKAGRRPLLLVGTAIQAAALGAVGWMFRSGGQGVGLLVCIVAFIAAFSMAMGPIPWILCSEIFPNRLRGRAMSVATFTIWTGCFAVAQTFPVLNDSESVGPAATFWIYGACSLLSFFFVWAMVPETKGKTLEAIEASWRKPADSP